MKKIIIIFIVIVLIIFFSVFFLVLNNNNYLNNLEKEIRENYEIKDKIIYLNKSNLYYIILTDENLIVLNDDYQEIIMEDKSKIKDLDKDLEIVYRLNQVMYEEKKVSNDKIVYYYYDIYSGELIDTLEIGG